MTVGRTALLFAGVTVLMLGIAACVIAEKMQAPAKSTVDVDAIFARMPADWVVRDLPLADNENLLAETIKILHFDDCRYKEIRCRQFNVDIYIAHWRAGSADPREIAWHNPDVCWVSGGWEALGGSSIERAVGKRKLKLVQERAFRHGEIVKYVWFWHLVGGKVHGYNTRGLNPWYSWLMDIWRYGLFIKREQVFVRIGSNTSFDALTQLAEFQKLVNSLEGAGVLQDEENGNN